MVYNEWTGEIYERSVLDVPEGRQYPSEETMRCRIARNEDGLAERLVGHLYDCQTIDEKRRSETIHDNSIGFNREDALVLTQIGRKAAFGEPLTRDEVDIARGRCPKYAAQYLGYLRYGPSNFGPEFSLRV